MVTPDELIKHVQQLATVLEDARKQLSFNCSYLNHMGFRQEDGVKYPYAFVKKWHDASFEMHERAVACLNGVPAIFAPTGVAKGKPPSAIFSEGEWTACKQNGRNPHLWCVGYEGPDFFGLIAADLTEENARFIAAAQKMHAALIACESLLSELAEGGAENPELEEARAALAKARGERP